MKQFILKEKPDRDCLVRFYDKDYHYLVRVRRLKPGDVFSALLPASDSSPQEVTVTVQNIDRETLTGHVTFTDTMPDKPEQSHDPIVLFQALPKGAKMDLIVRQAAELGISEIVPFVSEHSVPKKSAGGEKADRWRRIVKEARQQSGSPVDTRIREIHGSDELFAYWEKLKNSPNNESGEILGLIFSPAAAYSAGQQSPQGAVKSDGSPLEQSGFHRYLYKKIHLLVLAVGPEGGFSADELNRFTAAGFKVLSLGNTVLRTETAALFTAAAAKTILMERALWSLTL